MTDTIESWWSVSALDLRLSTLLFVSYDAETLNVINTVHQFEIWCQYDAQNYRKNVSIVTPIVISIVILTAILFCCCYRHLWQTYFSIVIFSVKFDGHHPMLYGLSNHWICNCCLFFLHRMINKHLKIYIHQIWLKFQVNMMKRTMQIKYLSLFLSSHLTAIFLHSNSFLLSTFVTDLRFFYRHFWTDNWNSTVIFEWQTAFNTENPIALLRISCKT